MMPQRSAPGCLRYVMAPRHAAARRQSMRMRRRCCRYAYVIYNYDICAIYFRHAAATLDVAFCCFAACRFD